MDHIRAVSRVIDACRECHLPLILAFIDYDKALDNVDTNAVLSTFVHQREDQSYMRAYQTANETGPRKYNSIIDLLPYTSERVSTRRDDITKGVYSRTVVDNEVT
ncbi:hypothetical protein KIN20_028478 [Parelaphostrongylus tenuis]|uniref:Uncharacterized protein n=1 Tax=Parelaphostrongylus tenuis TaxID=148309 RepID=A0AAD5R102_PARTN|nr:hypothetical protein KIN20_028478 [Parelaphostrongylus tenuis]